MFYRLVKQNIYSNLLPTTHHLTVYLTLTDGPSANPTFPIAEHARLPTAPTTIQIFPRPKDMRTCACVRQPFLHHSIVSPFESVAFACCLQRESRPSGVCETHNISKYQTYHKNHPAVAKQLNICQSLGSNNICTMLIQLIVIGKPTGCAQKKS